MKKLLLVSLVGLMSMNAIYGGEYVSLSPDAQEKILSCIRTNGLQAFNQLSPEIQQQIQEIKNRILNSAAVKEYISNNLGVNAQPDVDDMFVLGAIQQQLDNASVEQAAMNALRTSEILNANRD